MNQSQNIAQGGVLTAAGLAVLYFACISPVARFGLCALSSVGACLAIYRGGLKIGCLVYLATALTGWILLPDKGIALIYAALFGLYTLVKFILERFPKGISWLIKLGYANGAAGLIWSGVLPLLGLFPEALITMPFWFILAFNLLFIAYDIAFSKLISLFRSRSPRP